MRMPRATPWIAAALIVGGWAAAQTPPVAAPPARPAASAASHAVAASSRGMKSAPAPRPSTHPLWRELGPSQQQALAPLAAQWDTLNEAQKRKWIAMSANFPKMSGEEQAKLHSRMTEWVTLSPQQRTIARLNYGETKKLSPDDKKAKWEQYQALSPEEKKALAAKSTSPKPPTTAAAIRPVPREKLASVPQRPRTAPDASTKAPRIAAAPNQVDHNTLLPQPLPPPPPAVEPAVTPRPLPPQAGTPD